MSTDKDANTDITKDTFDPQPPPDAIAGDTVHLPPPPPEKE